MVPSAETLYCSNIGVCREFGKVGDACEDPFSGGGVRPICDFARYEWCNNAVPRVCAPPRIRDEGQPCNMLTGDKCAVGLVCPNPFRDPSSPDHCVSPPKEGDSCDDTQGDSCGDFLLECVNGQCQYGQYTGMCPAPSDG